MTEIEEALFEVSRFTFCVVESDVENVEMYFGRHCLDQQIYSRQNDDTDDITFTILRGEDARVESPFCSVDEMKSIKHQMFLDYYGSCGDHRISRIKSNPKYTLIEAPKLSFSPQENIALSRFVNKPVHQFSSTIRWDISLLNEVGDDLRLPSDPLSHNLFGECRPSKKMRQIVVTGYFNIRKRQLDYSFQQTGDPWEFENIDAHNKKKIEDRMNRSVLLGYLEYLDIDPVALIRDRELSDAVMFTSSQDGEPLGI